ncbi:3D domain-containing protein [Paenibacillus sp. P96]|uniref:3D domain-containing protein n=1 Tax=Paenibacillus zeirhizosphaerae TaxID=2987519 RepID=A0ABT9FVA5_9BACL|nr:3D domain-containing protein [Paenibacillus sp. P96]MDP4098663.1 3D domain-containing protein [Paenibacillus sp. P96]
MNWNKLFKAAVIAAGIGMMVNTVPVHAEAVYTAKDGDTYYKIANSYGLNVQSLMKANPEISADNIYAGRQIKLPGSGVNGGLVEAASVKAKSNAVSKLSASQVTAWGKTYSFSKEINVKASAYSASGSENGKWGAVDYFGNPLKLGTIAVDPSVIPMGTKVLVTGYSHPGLPAHGFVATASDMGGAIKGKRIDIFIPGGKSFVNRFGHQNVKLYVIK